MEDIEETKPMSGGCFVCLDERGWSNNALVYCDGKICSVAVHQACYGIVSVPKGPWFCKACEATKEARVLRCSLCPYQGGALKSAGDGKWAHVVCALYIPEVEFKNTLTMEPILTDKVPSEKFALECYICEGRDHTKYSTYGANMTCAKSGCNKNFHVTCGQIKGLLCEVKGANSTKYCGYCEQHISKSKKRPMTDEMCSKLYCPSLVEHHEISSTSTVSQQTSSPNAVNLNICKQEDGGAAQNITPEIENMQVDEKDPSASNLLPSSSASNISVPSTSNLNPAQSPSSQDLKVAQSAAGKVQRKKLISKGSMKSKAAEKSKVFKKNTGRGSRLARSKLKSDNTASKTAEVEEAPTQKSPTKRSHKADQKQATEFVLSPKHSFVSLANFGEESMQASEPYSIGSLRPTPNTQNGQVDIIAAVDGIFKKQMEEYYQFISKGLSKENSAVLNQFLELRNGNQKRDALLDQLKERRDQLLAIQACLSNRG